MKFTVHIPLGETAPGEFQTQPAIEQMAGVLELAEVDACYLTDHPAPAVERAARFGNGRSPIFAAPPMTSANRESGIRSVEQLAETIVRLRDMRAGFGRTGPFDVVIRPKVRLKFGQRGSAEQYLEALGEMVGAGVTWSMVDPPHASRQEFCDNVQWFGEEIVARLRG